MSIPKRSLLLTCAGIDCCNIFARVTSRTYCSMDCRVLNRRCGTCDELIPLDHKPTVTKGGFYCRSCDAERARLHRLNPMKKAREIAHHRLRKFGITFEQYEALHVAQAGVCAICGNPEEVTRRGAVKTLAVDHDHETGRIRGLLCNRCNTAVGLMRDDPDRLRTAAAYLTSPPVCDLAPVREP